MNDVQLWTVCPPNINVTYKGLIVVNKTKTRNVIVDIGAALQSIVGGEIKSMTRLTQKIRNELLEEAKQQARHLDANAIVGIQMTTSTVCEGSLDLVLYGTAIFYD
jgi:uncharacterized protein YbjQ (UPF0145 family)